MDDTNDDAPDGADNDDGPGVDALRAELVRERFDAAAARGRLDPDYVDVVLAQFSKTGQEPNRDNIESFIADLQGTKPKLFLHPGRGRNTSPVGGAAPAPTPGLALSAPTQWRALRAAGRTAEAEAFYRKNYNSIRRG